MCRLVTRSLKSCSSRYSWYQDDRSFPDLVAVIKEGGCVFSLLNLYILKQTVASLLKVSSAWYAHAGTRVGGIRTSRAWEPHGMGFSLFKFELDLILNEAVSERPVLKNWIHRWKVIHLLRVIFSFVLSETLKWDAL